MGKKFEIGEDGTVPLVNSGIKVIYASDEINTNWLLNKILGAKDLQITQVSNEQLQKFLGILYVSKLKMPDGTDSLGWLRRRIAKRFEQSLSQPGQTWETISRRYQFIIEQIDIMLATKTPDEC